jgi:acyl-CoA thioester hydrolase
MHSLTLRVYYEDTDLAGIVYYANYLKYIERGRSEAVRALGVDQVALKRDHGLVFAVRRVVADYLQPALFDDLLQVETALTGVGASRLDLRQLVRRDGQILFSAEVVLATLDASGRARRMPAEIRHRLNDDHLSAAPHG